MFLKNSSIDASLEFKPGRVQLCKVYRRKLGHVLCYDVAFKLRAVAVAERKSKEAAVREFQVDVRV